MNTSIQHHSDNISYKREADSKLTYNQFTQDDHMEDDSKGNPFDIMATTVNQEFYLQSIERLSN